MHTRAHTHTHAHVPTYPHNVQKPHSKEHTKQRGVSRTVGQKAGMVTLECHELGALWSAQSTGWSHL